MPQQATVLPPEPVQQSALPVTKAQAERRRQPVPPEPGYAPCQEAAGHAQQAAQVPTPVPAPRHSKKAVSVLCPR